MCWLPPISCSVATRRLCLQGLAAGLVAPQGWASTDRPLRVGAPESQKPFGSLVEAVLKDAGVPYELAYFPPVRAQALFAQGELDAQFFRIGNFVREHYPASTVMVGPLAVSRLRCFVRADAPQGDAPTVAYLMHRALGYVRGNRAAEDWVRRHEMYATALSQRESLFRMLLLGRLEVALDDEMVGSLGLLQAGLLSQVRMVGESLQDQPAYLVLGAEVPRRFPTLLPTFERWLRSGRWKKGMMAVNRTLGLPEGTAIGPLPDGSAV